MFETCREARSTKPRVESRRVLSPGTRLGPYEILSLLGAGGMGEVYRAHDPRLGRDVALKILPETLASDPCRRARFDREARTASALSDPNVVAVFDVGRDGEICYIVSELVEGGTLRDLLSARNLSLRKTLDLASQIASGLAAAHARGIVHRDLKPGNILISDSGTAKIADFGLAKPTDRSEPSLDVSSTETAPTARGMILGTVGYMSPEQVRGETVDTRSDIFSFGCVLYEMVTGHSAFGGRTPVDMMASILRDDPPPVSGLVPELPAELDRIIGHCLEKNPEQRFQSASDLAFALRAVSCGCAPAFVTSRDHRVRTFESNRLASSFGMVAALLRTILLTIP